MHCLKCGFPNPDNAPRCGQCGDAFAGPSRSSAESLVMAGPTYAAAPPAEVFIFAARARRFLMFFFLLLLVAGLGPGIQWAYGINVLGRLAKGLPLTGLTVAYIWFLHAYLVGSTARSTGLGFWSCFMLALLPPLVPFAWARIAQKRWWKPYLILALALGGAMGLTLVARNAWWAVQLIWLFAIPFLISAWFGGSVVKVTGILGLNPYIGGAWVCLVPAILAGIIGWDLGLGNVVVKSLEDQVGLKATLQVVLHLIQDAKIGVEQMLMFAGWFAISLLLWIKSIHENLRFPIF